MLELDLNSAEHAINKVIESSQLRDSCLKRVRMSRNEVLWRIRCQKPPPAWDSEVGGLHQDVTSTLKYILSDQIKASCPVFDNVSSGSPSTPPRADMSTIQSETLTSPPRNPMRTSPGALKHSSREAESCEAMERPGCDEDMLWEYDTRVGASASSRHGADELSGEEYEALLMEMQRALYEDLQEPSDLAEQEKVWELEAAEDMKHLEAAHEGPEVLCPFCRQLAVRQNGSVLFCSCGFGLDTGSEEMGLQYLQKRIQEVVDAHWEEGCTGQPHFVVEDQFEVETLCLRCACCSTFHILL